MDITPLVAADSQIIQGYGPGKFRVSGAVYETPLMVFPDHVEVWNFQGDIEVLKPHDFAEAVAACAGCDVVLFGCGGKMQMVPRTVKEVFSQQGMSIEGMDSGAACRTYNVLLTEGRRVAALLLPI